MERGHFRLNNVVEVVQYAVLLLGNYLKDGISRVFMERFLLLDCRTDPSSTASSLAPPAQLQ